jgi:hypothetical protein
LLRRASHSEVEWTVENLNGKFEARRRFGVSPAERRLPDFEMTVQIGNVDARPAKPYRTLPVFNGWIAAYNLGEFGSAVYWFSANGRSRKKLSEHRVKQFMLEGDRIFAIEGISHLGLSHGSMIEFRRRDQDWRIEEFMKFPASPEAIARIGPADYFVVTSDMLLRVNLSREMRIIVPTGNWIALYPNSIATDGEFVYIGMRQFVVRTRVSNSIEKFDLLVPDAKWLNDKAHP